MKSLIVSVLVLSLVGCKGPGPHYDEKLRGEMRLQVFNQCMEAASKITRLGDDDVSDIVKECSSQSYYISSKLSLIVE